jgi:hypothetical protein
MKRPRRSSARVREPVQVYLDPADRSLLDRLASRTGLSRAELLRRGVRQLAELELSDRPAGWSFERLAGALGDDPTLPADLSARHDEYLYGAAHAKRRRR